MSGLPSISIITPSYNQGEFLEQTIDSVLSQQYPGLQYIIIDGGSQDRSPEIIRKYERHLHFWISEPDRGQSDAINKGLQHATGEVVNWLNSDDYYLPGALKRVGECFLNPHTQVVCGRSRILLNEREIRQNKGTDLYPGNLNKSIGCARIDQPETFFRHDCIRTIGPLNPSLHYLMDKEWWMRYLLCFGQEQVVSIPDILVNFRLHENSKTYRHLSRFDQENMDLYYTIAQEWAPETARRFQTACAVKTIPGISYTALPVRPDVDFEKILNYFIWERAQMAYAQNRYPDARKLLALLQRPMPDAADESAIRQIETRMRLLPAWLKKFLNRIRS